MIVSIPCLLLHCTYNNKPMTMTNAYRLAWQMHQFKADVDFSCLLGLGNFMNVQRPWTATLSLPRPM